MRYSLLLHHMEPAPGEIPDEMLTETMAAFDAYAKDLDGAGVLCGSDVMGESQLSTTVTLMGGELKVQDGPFVESKEMLAGIFVIEVADLDAALAWAEKCPAAQFGTIEARPVANSFLDGEWRETCRLNWGRTARAAVPARYPGIDGEPVSRRGDRVGGPLDWRSLRRFYTELMTVAPTLGGAVALAVVIGEDEGPAAGLAQLGVIDAERLARFQPAWAARAHLHTALGDVAAASAAYAKAISLTTDAAARKYLERKQAQLPGDKPAAIS